MTDTPVDPFQHIDVERTIAEFGYDPRLLGNSSQRKVFWLCKCCKITKIKALQQANRDSHCSSCSKKKGIRSPETVKKILETKKARGYKHNVVGRKHSAETIEKIRLAVSNPSAETRRKRVIAQQGSKSHFFGKPPLHGKGKWYRKKNNSKVYMRSAWEIKYAEYLDSNSIDWEYETKYFEVKYILNGEIKIGTYTPDFYVKGEWFEVKGYWRDNSKSKFEAFKAQYPEERITLLMKPELLALGIDVK